MHYVQYLVAIKYEVVWFIDTNESLRSSEGGIVEETQYNIHIIYPIATQRGVEFEFDTY